MSADPGLRDRPSAAPSTGGRRFNRPAAMIAGGLVLIVLGAAAAVLLLTRNTLPGCAEQATRNSLATIFRENNVAMSGYEETREVGRSENEISCTAVVSLADGGKLDLTYRVVREPDRTIVRASWQRRAP